MTNPDGLEFGEAVPEAPEADVAEQRTPVAAEEDDTWRDAPRITAARDWEANEADLVEQAIEVPLADDEADFDR
ncbi:hypothetical protein ABGB19_13830 [Mycobacterium sp. B14F4]|uniref:hypothetical protein n=1 Tax=Mycobacterium sp. B14F4 TaxID=3153565 RepID=UPI00325D0AC5